MTKNGNVELSLHVDPNLPSVMADGEQLQQVFLNLANNAQEAMPGGGRLTITAKNLNSHLEITFTDTGEGISDENMGNIFDPLFTTKTKGTGLGLAVCQEIILRHGGTISVRRYEEPPGGTIFEVKLPVAVQTPDAQGGTANDGRIMVVDDDVDLRFTLQEILMDEGQDVILPEDGFQAVKMAAESRILIFMDIQMPDMNGVDAFLAIKEILPDCVVVIMTGYAVEDLIQKAPSEGAKTVLSNPVSIQQILEIIIDEVVPETIVS